MRQFRPCWTCSWTAPQMQPGMGAAWPKKPPNRPLEAAYCSCCKLKLKLEEVQQHLQDLGDEVVSSLLDLFMDGCADAAWHGGCLTQESPQQAARSCILFMLQVEAQA